MSSIKGSLSLSTSLSRMLSSGLGRSMFVIFSTQLLIAGCVTNPGVPPADRAETSRVQLASQPGPYVLQPGDGVEVKFPYTPELDETQTIRPEGAISMPLLNEPVLAAGLTVDGLKTLLLQEYAQTSLKNPRLTVVVRDLNYPKIFIGGEVTEPGPQPILAPTTVLQAILQAKGFKDTARVEQVLLIRQNGSGDPQWQVLNLEKALSGEDFSGDLRLAPHDVVYVPRTKIANVGVFVDQYVRRLLPFSPGINVPL